MTDLTAKMHQIQFRLKLLKTVQLDMGDRYAVGTEMKAKKGQVKEGRDLTDVYYCAVIIHHYHHHH